MNYFAIAAILTGAALLGAKPLQRVLPFVTRRLNAKLVLGMAAIVFLTDLVLGIYKVDALQMGLWDFGIYDSMMHIAATGGGLMRDFRGGLFDHFSPAVLLMLPMYWICDTPYNLVIFQSLVMAAAGPVLYLLASRYFRKPGIPVLLTAMYFLNPYYTRLVLFDFHIECLYPLVLFSAFLARAHRKHVWFAILMLATPLIKEDFIVPLGAAGLYFLCSKKERNYGILFLAGALIWTLFVLKVYFPLFSDQGYWHYGRYEFSGPALQEMVEKLFSQNALAVFLSVLLPFALLPLANWKMCLLFLLPTLGIQLISGAPHQNLLLSHYSSALIGVVPIAALWGVRSLRSSRVSTAYWGTAALLLTLLVNVVCTELPLVRYYSCVTGWEQNFHGGLLGVPLRAEWYGHLRRGHEQSEKFRILASGIPRNATVAAQNEVGTYFIRHRAVHSLEGAPESDFYVFNRNNYSGYERGELLNQTITRILADPAYHIWAKQDGILILSRKTFMPPTERANQP